MTARTGARAPVLKVAAAPSPPARAWDAEGLRALLFQIEPLAHNAKAYAEATRVLVEHGGDADQNTLVKVAYLAQDAADKLLDTLRDGLERLKGDTAECGRAEDRADIQSDEKEE